MVIYLDKKMERLNSGDQKMLFRTILSTLNIGLMMYGTARLQEAEETRKDFNIVLIHQDKNFFTFELQGHSGRNLIDPSLQDNVLIPDNFFEYTYHIGCAINLLSFTNSGLSDTGWTHFEQNTDGILYVCGSYEQRTHRSE